MSRLFAEVAVNSTLPHRQTFSYEVPAGLGAAVGQAVYVPFGRKLLQGVVLEIHDTPIYTEPEKIRPIVSLIETAPAIEPARIELAWWISREYLAPIYDCIALMLPPGFDQRPVTYVRATLDEDELAGLDLPARQAEVARALTADGRLSMDELRRRLSFAVEPAVAQLERRGFARREYELARPRVTGKTVDVATLRGTTSETRTTILRYDAPKHSRRADLIERLVEKRSISDEEAIRLAGSRGNLERLVRAGTVRPDREGHAIELAMSPLEALDEVRALRMTARAARALAVIDALSGGERTATELRAIADMPTLRWLEKLGVIGLQQREVERDPLAELHVERRPPATLLPAQSAAAQAIVQALNERDTQPLLLHGVTGSGKTEVYLDALAHCTASGRRAIVLVPEIALTPQTVRRFRERFDAVAVLHSGLQPGERFDQWRGVSQGRYDVVIGPRSAIYAPQPDLGLIIVDEEHEQTYKQQDPQPRYHARDVAIALARLAGASVVLGSATPSIESYARGGAAQYRLLSLPERVRPVDGGVGGIVPQTTPEMPPITVVDMRDELRSGNRSMFSGVLHDAIARSLDAREQVILFLNRRGLAGHVQCRDCGWVPECSGCFVAVTYHRQDDRLVCHMCNRRLRLPRACSRCKSPRIRLVGAGIEKVEAEAARAFPSARLLRWDSDSVRHRDHGVILSQFERHEADILIGTQMLAKGLDLPGVTVAGAINADIGLHLPDFRAGERTFQLLTQLAGRAGRGERAGHAYIQTYQPDHYAIDAASRYDYEGFAEAELASRKQAG